MSTTQAPVSLIIPTYNKKEYLQAAIDSALKQDYLNLDIIITDDGSTDGTAEMMRSYHDQERIKYYRHDLNVGIKKNAYNALYHLASGKYAIFLDHDDYLIDDSYITKAVEFLEKNPTVSFVFGNCNVYNMDTTEMIVSRKSMPPITNGTDYFLHYEDTGYCHVTSGLGCVFNRSRAISMECLTEETYAMDLFLWLKLMLTGDVGFIDRCAGVYRMHKNSLSNNLDIDHDYSTIKELVKLKEMAICRGLSKQIMDNWINVRVYAYVSWVFSMQCLNGRTKDAYNLINSIETQFPGVYQALCACVQKEEG